MSRVGPLVAAPLRDGARAQPIARAAQPVEVVRGPDAMSSPAGRIDAVPAPRVSPVFAGRHGELAVLGAALERARDGDPGVVLVTGEAGIGKSRLVEEAAAAARAAGARVLTGACVDLGEDALPHAPLVAALRDVVRADGAGAVAALVPGRADVLAALVPELGSASSAAGLPRGQLHEVLLDLLDALGAAAEGGLVLVLEDLHWADGATRGALDVLARRLRGRVLVVATVRTDALHRGHVLRPLLAELERLRTVTRLELDRLDPQAVAVQLAGILGHAADPGTAAAVVERSEGNPFFVEELVCSGSLDSCGLADSLRDLLLARVERLDPDVQHVLRRMSAGGSCLHHGLVAAVCDLPEDRLAAALAEAVSHRVLVPAAQEECLAFRHSLVREALHEDLLPGEHSQIHVRYARALEGNPGLLPTGGAAAETAHHWYSAHDLPRALPATLAAAAEARSMVAYAEEQRLLERALGLWESLPAAAELAGTDHAELLLRTGRAARDAGEPERELALVEAALSLLDRGSEPVRVARALEQRSATLRLLARPGGVEGVREALDLLPADVDPAVRASLLASLAKALMLVPAPEEAIAVAEQGLEVARAASDVRSEALLVDALGCSLILVGQVERGSALVREAAGLARTLLEVDDVRTCVNLSDVLEHTGHHEEAVVEALRGVQRAAAVGDARTYGTLLAGNAAESLLALGRWDEAREHVEAALAEDPRGVHSSFLHRLLADLLLERGELEPAAAHLQRAHGDLGRHYPGSQYHLPVARTLAELALAQGDPERAVVVAEHALRRGMAPYEPRPSIALEVETEDEQLVRRRAASARYAWPVLEVGARALAELALLIRDRRDDAALARVRAAGDRLRALAGGLPAELAPYRAWRASAVAELDRVAAGAGDEVEPGWAGAVEAWEASPSVLPLARARMRAAEQAAARGRREPAGHLLRLAAAAADALGADPLRGEIGDLARRARIDLLAAVPAASVERRTVDVEPAAGLGLTPRESEVLALVAQGLSNGQIAERLFITTKTASVHVSNILAKLGVSTRVEAAATAHRLRLFEEDRASVR
ncbi:MAG: helix-turn-helix transcriptional regulator [Motilibacteraceae bacterium]